MASELAQTGSQRLIGQIRRRGLPLTKASFLVMMFDLMDPEFPLDAEDEALVRNSGLPGPLPTSLADLYPVATSTSTSRRSSTTRRKRKTSGSPKTKSPISTSRRPKKF